MKKVTIRDDFAALPFLLPFMTVFLVFIGYPLVYSAWISLHRVTLFTDYYDVFGTMEFVGLGNYALILTDPFFLWSVFLTLIYSVLMIAPGIALSLFLALFLNKQTKVAGFMRSGFFLPNVFDIYVVGVIWLLIYNPSDGIISGAMRLLGFGPLTDLADQGLLGNAWTSLPAIALVMVLKNAGFGMILFLIRLNNISESIFEAADVDGASPWQKLIHITVPQLKPTILFLTITGLVGSLNAFAEIFALTDNTGGVSFKLGESGPILKSANISGYHLYKTFDQFNYGQAAAISFMLLFLAIIIGLINWMILGEKKS